MGDLADRVMDSSTCMLCSQPYSHGNANLSQVSEIPIKVCSPHISRHCLVELVDGIRGIYLRRDDCEQQSRCEGVPRLVGIGGIWDMLIINSINFGL